MDEQRGSRSAQAVSAPLSFADTVEWLASVYQFRDRGSVTAFLEQNQFLAPLLVEAYTRIREHFGGNARIALEVFTDPESQQDQEAFALVLTDLSPTEAAARLDRLDEEWWFDASHQARCKLNLDVEYV